MKIISIAMLCMVMLNIAIVFNTGNGGAVFATYVIIAFFTLSKVRSPLRLT